MAIVDEILASGHMSDGTPVEIELTVRHIIHIHIGALRFEFSRSEFDAVAQTVINGAAALRRAKHEIDHN